MKIAEQKFTMPVGGGSAEAFSIIAIAKGAQAYTFLSNTAGNILAGSKRGMI